MVAMTSKRDRAGEFNYLRPEVASSLYRNGRVGLDRDPDGNDSNLRGLDMEKVSTTVIDARALPDAPTIGAQGFELLERRLEQPDLDFFDHEAVARRYYPEVEAIMTDALGAASARAFDHNVRWAGGKAARKRLEGGQDVQAPIHLTHGDYTLTSAPARLRQLCRPPSGNDTLKGILGEGESALDADDVEAAIRGDRRFAIINLWRNIAAEPVATHPLAFCDAQTVEPSDLVVFEIHYQDRVGENYFTKHAPRHRWHYYPAMTRDEPVLLKQWDSAGGIARSKGEAGDVGTTSTFTLHSAFDDPTSPPDAPDRTSIEVRCVVMY
jgi:hypothetical protein